MGHPRRHVVAVAIQDRSPLFREGLSLLVGVRPTIRVAATVEVLADSGAGGSVAVDAVVMEVADVPWDVEQAIGNLRERFPGIVVVGTYPGQSPPSVAFPGVALVHRTAPSAAFVDALRGAPMGVRSRSGPLRQASPTGTAALTRREYQVLALIGSGQTTARIAERLGIKIKTVESRRQTLFSKLGVQNQSAAVAVAMRSGLLGSSTSITDAP